jgi:sugar O-acyltransferase (sialic acid O-acetyltransferase NeuD family)
MTIVVLGAGPHGRELAEVAVALGRDIVFFDDDPDVPSKGPVGLLATHRGGWVVGAAWPAVRRKILEQCSEFEGRAAILVHPAATLGCDTHLSGGVVVAAGARLGPDVIVGAHSHVGLNATISRDCRVGGCVTVCPGAHVAGGVVIADDVFVGIGAAVKHELVIGEGVLIGAGAVVVEDVAPGTMVVGNPARPVR